MPRKKETQTEQEQITANIILFDKNTKGVKITSGEKWYKRIWNTLSNPFTYLFHGFMRY